MTHDGRRSYRNVIIPAVINVRLRDEKVNEWEKRIFFPSGITLCCNFLSSVSRCVWLQRIWRGSRVLLETSVKRDTWSSLHNFFFPSDILNIIEISGKKEHIAELVIRAYLLENIPKLYCSLFLTHVCPMKI